jgi:hypothetical protein
MNAESDSRALSAIEDLVHRPAFDHAELIVRELRRLRRNADTLHATTERLVGAELQL